MKRLQMAGNKPIALIGDGTTLIGDPSGRKMCIRDRCYVHKALTGRQALFETLRQFGGLSGFPKPYESEHLSLIHIYAPQKARRTHGCEQHPHDERRYCHGRGSVPAVCGALRCV